SGTVYVISGVPGPSWISDLLLAFATLWHWLLEGLRERPVSECGRLRQGAGGHPGGAAAARGLMLTTLSVTRAAEGESFMLPERACWHPSAFPASFRLYVGRRRRTHQSRVSVRCPLNGVSCNDAGPHRVAHSDRHHGVASCACQRRPTYVHGGLPCTRNGYSSLSRLSPSSSPLRRCRDRSGRRPARVSCPFLCHTPRSRLPNRCPRERSRRRSARLSLGSRLFAEWSVLPIRRVIRTSASRSGFRTALPGTASISRSATAALRGRSRIARPPTPFAAPMRRPGPTTGTALAAPMRPGPSVIPRRSSTSGTGR